MEQGIRVSAIAQPARALQYLPETEALLNGLDLPTGKVTVQLADEMNRVPNRCYVPTTWGSAVLEYGDWVVAYDSGIVLAATATQFVALFDLSSEPRGSELDFSGLLFEGAVDELAMQSVAESASPQSSWEAVAPGAPAPVLQFQASLDGSWVPSFEAYCARYRLDYTLRHQEVPETSGVRFDVIVNATGALAISFSEGSLVDAYPDGGFIVREAGEA